MSSGLGQRLSSAMVARMCGRVRLSSDVSEITLVFSIPPHRPTPNFARSWNAAPTDLLPVVRYDRKAGERSLDLLRRGLIPHWAKEINVRFANINAKAEGIEKSWSPGIACERNRHAGFNKGVEHAARDAGHSRRRIVVRIRQLVQPRHLMGAREPHRPPYRGHAAEMRSGAVRR